MAGGNGGEVLDSRQRVEGDRQLGGGRDAADGGSEGGVELHGGVDEGDRDGVALLQEGVRELHHRDEVAHGEAGVENHGLPHWEAGLSFWLAGAARGQNA